MDGCHECGDEFHYDDTGGYNPPCPCGCGRCRWCCNAESERDEDDWQDYEIRPGIEPGESFIENLSGDDDATGQP
jgi:hypothetical protein